MPTKAKAKATSRASVNNLVKIVLNDRKARRRRRKTTRRTKRQAQSDQQMDLLTTLASRPPMRAVSQPDPAKQQNDLMTSSLLATNEAVVRALNNLNVPSYSTGFAPPPFPEAPTTLPEEESAPPETPAGKYAQQVRLARMFLVDNLDSIPTWKNKKKDIRYRASDIMDMAPNYVMKLATQTKSNIGPGGGQSLFMDEE